MRAGCYRDLIAVLEDVHGDRDRSAPIEVTGIPSAELIPGCRFLTYKGAPHGLMYTHMDQLHADILQFIREQG